MAPRVPDGLVEFIESGVSILLGTRDDDLVPEAMRACGAVVDQTRTRLTVYAHTRVAERTLANLRANRQMAVTFSRAIDHHTVQLKGECVEMREADARDDAIVDAYKSRFVEQLYIVGMPRSITSRFCVRPAWALTLAIADIFVQTPGPGAGARMEVR